MGASRKDLAPFLINKYHLTLMYYTERFLDLV